ncbi:hemin ABC transporter substrate-binding protein [Rhodobacter sp. SY28-1]|uniref:heme/hemin ABC transporter substrate-binding protein n=1 Tax=Rhodobacter sp. SY28-1 TaxID=2562317 RepID=UPI0010C10BA5|nr:ABC transporter substrate-binding protein [Rhodobacter sp. SY28-1]
MIRLFCLSLALATPALADRVITLGGSVTEIAVALGAEGRLVARDTTSNFPASVQALPDVGYIRALSPENILALDPSLILAEGDAGPPEAVEVLKAAGIPFVLVPEATDPAGVAAKIIAVADVLDLTAQGAALATSVTADLAAAQSRAADVTAPKRVLFVLSLKGGGVMAGGEGTEADGIIRLAGGINAASGFQGYKPMTDEAVLTAQPDAILMMDREGELSISDADVLAQPALSQTPAARTRTILRMDGMLLLGFGPRTPAAATALHDALYGSEG